MLRIAVVGRGTDRPSGPGSGSGAGRGLKIKPYRASMIGAKLRIVPKHPRRTVILVTCDQPI